MKVNLQQSLKPILIFSLLFLWFFSYSQTPYWQQHLDYTIDISLNDKDNSLTGFEKIIYTNNSPDTLTYIWFHLWPNAYKNDRTAFSEQKLQNGYTDFYFSDEKQRGYINQLDFKIDNATAVVEEDSLHLDIIKVLLPQPLAPQRSATITTPFHVKLPYNFSRSGYVGHTYQITQWYPKPAVYDSKGWHPLPYLDQGEFYSEYANWKVNITLPENYIVAASGNCMTKDELQKLKEIGSEKPSAQKNYKWFQSNNKKAAVPETIMPLSSNKNKTLTYTLSNAHDFAWFASKLFVVQHGTLKISDNTIDAFSYYHPWQADEWNNSISYIKDAVKFYSAKVGDYPYNIVSAVAGADNVASGGMEYPTITLITTSEGGHDLDATITHEVGHNWFYGVLGSNERDHAWMDEGINTFYQEWYEKEKYHKAEDYTETKNKFLANKYPENFYHTLIASVEKIKKDQPIDTASAAYTELNYGLIVYEKTPMWLELLRQQLGETQFDSSMHYYYSQWKFKHPYPEDFKQSIEQSSNQNIDSLYSKLFSPGSLQTPLPKSLRLTAFFNLKETDKYNYISFLPAVGYNNYDKAMIGLLVHNYQLPLNKFNFLAAPLYATNTSKLNGVARLSYSAFTKRFWMEASVSGTAYSVNDFTRDDGSKLYLELQRIVPSLKFTLYNKDLRSTEKWILQARSFILREDRLMFTTVTTPTDTFFVTDKKAVNTLINQLNISVLNYRVLYPYSANLTIDQGEKFIRAGLTGKYFFNYGNNKEGMQLRFFAGKFFYLQQKTFFTQYETDRYQLNLSGPKGYEDYTYSDYFIGRNEFEGWQSQQIMERDGFFKVRTDFLSSKIGKSDDWLIALNLSGDIPDEVNPLKVLPVKLPVKFFIDVGTSAEAWNDNASTGRFLYDAGLQFSPFKSLINIYFPLLYSRVYSDYFKSTLGEKRFWKTVSFNINLNVFQLNKLSKDIPL